MYVCNTINSGLYSGRTLSYVTLLT